MWVVVLVGCHRGMTVVEDPGMPGTRLLGLALTLVVMAP